MNSEVFRGLVTHLALSTFVPFLLGLLIRLFPAKQIFEPGSADAEHLKRRNNWIDRVACGICLLALFSACFLYATVLDDRDFWGLGFGFGMAVLAPVFWITAVTLPAGKWRLVEFWVFYSEKYKVSWLSLGLIYVPLCLLGVVSTAVLVDRFMSQL